MSGTEYPITDDPDTTYACPECDSCDVAKTSDGRWMCRHCSATDIDPVERERYRSQPPTVQGRGSSKLGLEDLSPEDLGLSPIDERKT